MADVENNGGQGFDSAALSPAFQGLLDAVKSGIIDADTLAMINKLTRMLNEAAKGNTQNDINLIDEYLEQPIDTIFSDFDAQRERYGVKLAPDVITNYFSNKDYDGLKVLALLALSENSKPNFYAASLRNAVWQQRAAKSLQESMDSTAKVTATIEKCKECNIPEEAIFAIINSPDVNLSFNADGSIKQENQTVIGGDAQLTSGSVRQDSDVLVESDQEKPVQPEPEHGQHEPVADASNDALGEKGTIIGGDSVKADKKDKKDLVVNPDEFDLAKRALGFDESEKGDKEFIGTFAKKMQDAFANVMGDRRYADAIKIDPQKILTPAIFYELIERYSNDPGWKIKVSEIGSDEEMDEVIKHGCDVILGALDMTLANAGIVNGNSSEPPKGTEYKETEPVELQEIKYGNLSRSQLRGRRTFKCIRGINNDFLISECGKGEIGQFIEYGTTGTGDIMLIPNPSFYTGSNPICCDKTVFALLFGDGYNPYLPIDMIRPAVIADLGDIAFPVDLALKQMGSAKTAVHQSSGLSSVKRDPNFDKSKLSKLFDPNADISTNVAALFEKKGLPPKYSGMYSLLGQLIQLGVGADNLARTADEYLEYIQKNFKLDSYRWIKAKAIKAACDGNEELYVKLAFKYHFKRLADAIKNDEKGNFEAISNRVIAAAYECANVGCGKEFFVSVSKHCGLNFDFDALFANHPEILELLQETDLEKNGVKVDSSISFGQSPTNEGSNLDSGDLDPDILADMMQIAKQVKGKSPQSHANPRVSFTADFAGVQPKEQQIARKKPATPQQVFDFGARLGATSNNLFGESGFHMGDRKK